MKKLVIIALISLVGFSGVYAQDSTLKVKVGYFFCPQGVITLKDMSGGTSVATPVFGVMQFIQGKGLVNVMYNMAVNNLQAVYFHELNSMVGAYLVSNKSTLTSDGYSGIGFTKNVMNGNAVAFLEGGSSWKKWTPTIFAGVIFPLTFQIK